MDGYDQRAGLERGYMESDQVINERARKLRLQGTLERMEGKIDKLTIELKQLSEKVNNESI